MRLRADERPVSDMEEMRPVKKIKEKKGYLIIISSSTDARRKSVTVGMTRRKLFILSASAFIAVLALGGTLALSLAGASRSLHSIGELKKQEEAQYAIMAEAQEAATNLQP